MCSSNRKPLPCTYITLSKQLRLSNISFPNIVYSANHQHSNQQMHNYKQTGKMCSQQCQTKMSSLRLYQHLVLLFIDRYNKKTIKEVFVLVTKKTRFIIHNWNYKYRVYNSVSTVSVHVVVLCQFNIWKRLKVIIKKYLLPIVVSEAYRHWDLNAPTVKFSWNIDLLEWVSYWFRQAKPKTLQFVLLSSRQLWVKEKT